MGQGGFFGEPVRRPLTFPPEKCMLDSTSQPLVEDFSGGEGGVGPVTIATLIIAHSMLGTDLGPSQVLTQLHTWSLRRWVQLATPPPKKKKSAFHFRWPKYWSFTFNISASNEHPGLISFRMGWLDLLAVQETLKSLLQHHSSKPSILLHSAFFIVQLSHPYMTTGKTIALTRQTFVDKVMSLLFNMLSRLVITFLPRNKRLLISWL